jgi:hypothetical protein
MGPPTSNSRLHNNEIHSGEQSFHDRRQLHYQYFSDNEIETTATVDASMYDDGHYTFTGVAQEARVIRASPIVKRDKAEVPRCIALSDKLEKDIEGPIMGTWQCTKPNRYIERSSLQSETSVQLDECRY